LKILIVLRSDNATERWQWGSLNQQFTALKNMHD